MLESDRIWSVRYLILIINQSKMPMDFYKGTRTDRLLHPEKYFDYWDRPVNLFYEPSTAGPHVVWKIVPR